ncbi:MAG: winged helix-turn-helix domain-containing protein [Variovorax sp.]|nr:winged helix-turn-helix domain-containing protein [Variovorax sp.]
MIGRQHHRFVCRCRRALLHLRLLFQDAQRRQVVFHLGCELDLSTVEFQLLGILVRQPGRIFTRAQLIDAMYVDGRVVEDRTVDSHIKKLRRKIATVFPDREILFSVYGVGYRYEW